MGPKLIEAVSTSVAGVVGVTQKGPVNKPTLVTSFVEFQRIFGGYLDQSYGEYRYLPYAVEGFFQNGGKKIYISRLDVMTDPKLTKDETVIGEDSEKPDQRTGLQTLKNIYEISLIAVPNGTSQKIQQALIAQCEQTKDRFAILDPAKNSNVSQISQQRQLYDSKYAALYYPWINIKDPFSAQTMPIPPSGHILGIYARTDTERGVHKAPANQTVKGTLGPEIQVTKSQQDLLNPIGINCMREFPGRGFQVWGARTTSNDPTWRYVNVRRLIIFLEKSIQQGTQWAVFEENTEKLWTKITQNITLFLTRVWTDGALMGTTQKDAFFVRCDRTTMTQNDIDNGRLIALIGVAPTEPAEFVIFRIAQKANGSASFE